MENLYNLVKRNDRIKSIKQLKKLTRMFFEVVNYIFIGVVYCSDTKVDNSLIFAKYNCNLISRNIKILLYH